MRVLFSAFLIALLSSSVSCGESLECNAENHCLFANGESQCEEGYQWVNSDAAADFRCEEIPHVDIPVLGNGSHSLDSVTLTVIGTTADSLNVPRDLEFHPTVPDQLWVVNHAYSSVVIFSNVGSESQSSVKKQALFDNGSHFLADPAALSFGDNGRFATIHETDQETQGPVSQGGTPSDFMGPTLWTSDANSFTGGHNSHYDMMHNSPNGMGIAWEKDNVYWVFDGFHSSITRYDFGTDHGAGGTWHDDGAVSRYVEGEVKRTSDVGSHLEFDPSSKLLYIADTGNQRIATLATDSGTRGSNMPNYEVYDCYQQPGQGVTCSDYHYMNDATLQTFVDGAAHGISKPSGLALHNNAVYVTDYATGTIFAFDKTGMLMDWLKLERPNTLGGIDFDSQGNLYIADTGANEILRVSPR